MSVTGSMLKTIAKLLTLSFTREELAKYTMSADTTKRRNIDIVKLICKELGKPESLIVHVGDRKGHDMRYAIDPTKIHNELGWLTRN